MIPFQTAEKMRGKESTGIQVLSMKETASLLI